MTTTAAPDVATATRHARWRTILAWVLLVTALVLTPITMTAVWVRNLLLDTNHYVETMAPLARDPRIQTAIATRVTNEIFADQRVQDALKSKLPDSIDFLAAPAAQALRQTTYNVTLKLTESKQFQTVWDGANRAAHTSVDKALTGNGTVTLKVRNGKIVLDLTPIYAEVAKRLESTSLGIGNRLPLSAINKTFVIANVTTLQGAQTATRLLDATADFLPWIVIAMLLAAVFLFKDRRKGALRVGVGLLIATLLFAVVLALARAGYVNAASNPTAVSVAAQQAVFDITFRFLRLGNRTIMAVGLVIALVAALAGRSRAALAVRGAFSKVSAKAAAEGGERGVLGGPVSAFVARNLMLLEVIVVVAAFLVFAFVTTPSPMTVLWITLATVAVVIVLAIVARAGRDAQPA
jgi:hypothetical protein